MPDSTAVNSMFARIAARYDLANHLLSMGMDHLWRRRLVRLVHDFRPHSVLDLATGSGDVAFALADGLPVGVEVTGMDFCQPMLDQAIIKQRASERWAQIQFVQGDGMQLPVESEKFDALTISFGLRNMSDRHQALIEMRRVLRPGGRLYVLEFSQPAFWFRFLYYAYLKQILPRIAGLVTGDRSAYEYLCGSIAEFPDRDALSREFSNAGFVSVRAVPLSAGIVALHVACVS